MIQQITTPTTAQPLFVNRKNCNFTGDLYFITHVLIHKKINGPSSISSAQIFTTIKLNRKILQSLLD